MDGLVELVVKGDCNSFLDIKYYVTSFDGLVELAVKGDCNSFFDIKYFVTALDGLVELAGRLQFLLRYKVLCYNTGRISRTSC